MTGAEYTRRVMRAVEVTLFVVAAMALGWYGVVRLDAVREQTALSHELEVGRSTLPALQVARTAVAPHALVGRIDLPRLRLSAMAREGVDTRTLRSAAGHVPGTALPGDPGNAAFAAHRDTFFARLKGVRIGDDVTVTTEAGRFHYVISTTQVVDPSDVSVLRATTEPTLTLITCYPFDAIGSAPKRFIVTARMVNGKPRV